MFHHETTGLWLCFISTCGVLFGKQAKGETSSSRGAFWRVIRTSRFCCDSWVSCPNLKYTIVYTHLKWHEVKCTSRLLEVASLPLRWRPWNVWKSQRIRRKTPWRVVLLGWRHRVDFLGKDNGCSHSNSRPCYYVVNASCRTRFVKHFMFILLGSNMSLYIHIQIYIYIYYCSLHTNNILLWNNIIR